MIRFASAWSLTLAVGLGVPAGTLATTIPVTSRSDDVDVNGNCTLREAVLAANGNAAVDACPGGEAGPGTVDLILVPSGSYTLAVGSSGEDAGLEGDLDLTDDVRIAGVGAPSTVVDAAQIDRVFDVGSGVAVTIEGLTIAGGSVADSGGGVLNGGELTLVDCTLLGNRADGPGGGIRNNGQVFVFGSTLVGNVTDDHGGGIDNHGQATIENATVSGNTVNGGAGGGLYNASGEEMTVTSTTVVGNGAASADAIHNDNQLTLTNVLVDGGCGGGGVTTTAGGNVESPGDTCGLGASDQVNVADSMLGPLAFNGGPTETHALMAGSPAIDTAVSGLCPSSDQRRAGRPADGDGDGTADCDVGAVEAGGDASLVFIDGFESGDTSAWALAKKSRLRRRGGAGKGRSALWKGVSLIPGGPRN